jgi:hypothetical protein
MRRIPQMHTRLGYLPCISGQVEALSGNRRECARFFLTVERAACNLAGVGDCMKGNPMNLNLLRSVLAALVVGGVVIPGGQAVASQASADIFGSGANSLEGESIPIDRLGSPPNATIPSDPFASLKAYDLVAINVSVVPEIEVQDQISFVSSCCGAPAAFVFQLCSRASIYCWRNGQIVTG